MSNIPRETNERTSLIRERLQGKKENAVSKWENIKNNMGLKNALEEFNTWKEKGKKGDTISVVPFTPECMQLHNQPDAIRSL
jgi:hypothetical protein